MDLEVADMEEVEVEQEIMVQAEEDINLVVEVEQRQQVVLEEDGAEAELVIDLIILVKII